MIYGESVALWLELNPATANDRAGEVAQDIEYACEALIAKHGLTQRQMTFFAVIHLLNRIVGHEDAEERRNLVEIAGIAVAKAAEYPGPSPADRIVVN